MKWLILLDKRDCQKGINKLRRHRTINLLWLPVDEVDQLVHVEAGSELRS